MKDYFAVHPGPPIREQFDIYKKVNPDIKISFGTLISHREKLIRLKAVEPTAEESARLHHRLKNPAQRLAIALGRQKRVFKMQETVYRNYERQQKSTQ